LNTEIAVIAAGGVFSREDFREKLEAGADLVQIYTGLVYRGPGIVRSLLR
jgi:dihydroorotate dehydrogenase